MEGANQNGVVVAKSNGIAAIVFYQHVQENEEAQEVILFSTNAQYDHLYTRYVK